MGKAPILQIPGIWQMELENHCHQKVRNQNITI